MAYTPPQPDVTPASQNVTTQDLVSATATGANGQSIITGTPTANSAASFAFASYENVFVQLSGTWTGTVQSELSFDGGTTWFIRGVHQSGTVYTNSTFTGNIGGVTNIASATNFRIRATAAMTGTLTVKITISCNPYSVTVANSLKLIDGQGTTNQNTIKAASTAAVATDPAFVVAISPNNTPVLPSNAAIETGGNLATIVSRTPATSIIPTVGTDAGSPIRSVPQTLYKPDFSSVLASTWNSSFTLIATGSGQAVSQSAGSGNITSGTTANAETILRSTATFKGSILLREQVTMSQRIVNNNFYIELVDVIGDALVLTAINATSCTVTIPSNPFTSANVGQGMFIGAISAGTIPGVQVPIRAVIASVSGNNVTFTVAGWTGATSGTGTCSLFGWNYHQVLYDGASATAAKYDEQRKGWNTGYTTVAINTTATGHVGLMKSEDNDASYSDEGTGSSTTVPYVSRASRQLFIADENATLYLQIRCTNGTTNPATTTTFSTSMVTVENNASQPITISNVRPAGPNSALRVTVDGTPSINTVTTLTTLTTLANGQTAHSSAATGSPLRTGGIVAPTTIATQDVTLVAGDAANTYTSSSGQLITKDNATAELDYNFVFSTVGTTVTVQPLVQASGTASIRNYIKSIRISSDALGAAGTVWILDGALTISSIAITTGLTTTSSNHDLKIGDAFVFTALAAGTGVTANTLYYVTSVGSATTFNFALTPGGANVVPSVAYTGTTGYRILDQIRFQTTALNPTSVAYAQAIKGAGNSIINLLIPTSLTSGNIYLTVNGYRGF